MQKLKKDLQGVTKALKALTKKVEQIQKQIEKAGKSKAAKPKTIKKTPAKKTAAKKPVTAIDTVLAIIKRSKKGVNTASIMKKTGYDKKKVANIIFKLKTQGKIKSATKGVYVKA